jgi:hypothetical protein
LARIGQEQAEGLSITGVGPLNRANTGQPEQTAGTPRRYDFWQTAGGELGGEDDRPLLENQFGLCGTWDVLK